MLANRFQEVILPRHRKNETVLKLEGGFRQDRHADRNEGALAVIRDTVPPCPTTITNKDAIAAWNSLLLPLVNTKRIADEDLQNLELAFLALQDVYELTEVTRSEIFQTPISRVSEEYARIENVINKRSQFFAKTMGRFGCTSQDRLAILGAMSGIEKNIKSLAEKMTE